MRSVDNTTAQKASNASRVRLVITPDHVAVLDPPVPELVPSLRFAERTFEASGPTGVRERAETVACATLDVKGRLCFPAGLLRRVFAVLRDHGYRVAVDDRRRLSPRMRLDRTGLGEVADPATRSVLAAVARELLGQVEVGTRAAVVDHIVAIVEGFPRARIAVAIATRRRARSLWWILERRLGQRVGLAAGTVRRRCERVTVGTFGSIPRRPGGNRDPFLLENGEYAVGEHPVKQYDALLLPDGEEATGNLAMKCVIDLTCRHVYAFVRPQRRRDRRVDLTLEMMAGHIIHCLRKPRARVRVAFLTTPPGCMSTATGSPLKKKKKLYWHNGPRNAFIAEVAQAVAAGDVPALVSRGLRVRDIEALPDDRPIRVVILVESTEHGRALTTLLPDWTMAAMVPTRGDTGAATTSVRPPVTAPTIVTETYAAWHRVTADVLIRATGTPWPLRAKGFPPVRTKKRRHVLLLDFSDTFNAIAVAEMRRRRIEYERLGWTVTTAGP